MPPFIEVVRIDKTLPLPKYQTDGAAGLDLFTVHSGTILAKCSGILSTGIRVSVPFGYKGTIQGRSGLGFKNDILPFIGTIDHDFIGEIKVKLFNFGDHNYTFSRGDRICQLCIEPAPQAIIQEVQELTPTRRGENGFGSTGKN